ncbi:DAO-domain-containing protein [Meredithblackwellia eburnea MCA 4105]
MIFDAPTFTFVQEHLPNDLPPCALPQPNPLPSFWTANFSSPLTDAGKDEPLPEEVDIVVIGSGLTGVSTVARLVQGLMEEEGDGVIAEGKTVKIVVLEARQFCSGATGRNGGHLTPAPVYHFGSIAKLSSVDNARRSVMLEDRAAAWVIHTCKAEGWVEDVDLVQGGCVHFFKDANSEALVRAGVEVAKKAGVDVSSYEWISGDEALKRYGATTHSAVKVPGNNIYPLKFVTKLFTKTQSQASASGGKVSLNLFTSTPVTEVRDSPEGTRVLTTRGAISTKYVLHATNAYASHLLPSLAVGPSRIVPTRGQVISVVPTSTSTNPHWTSAFSASEAFEYYFQRPNSGPIILGGGRAFAGDTNFEFGQSDDGSLNGDVGEKLREYLKEQFPKWFEGGIGDQLEASAGKVEREWTGIMAYRPSGEPIVGRVFVDGEAQKGQFISAGYTGHGMTRAPACAEIVAGMMMHDILGKKEPYMIPAWFPTHYLATAEDSLSVVKGTEKKGWSCLIS